MKKLMFIVALGLFNSAFAQDGVAINFGEGLSETPFRHSYGFNQELGRAWVEAEVSGSTEENTSTFRGKVQGLHFDAASNAIVLEVNGQKIDCAHVYTGRVFRTKVVPTGLCGFTSVAKVVTVDDGYNVLRTKKFFSYLTF